MALPGFSTQSLWGLPLILSMSLLAGCNSESTTDNSTNLVTEAQSCSRGAMALSLSCGDEDNAPATNETLSNNTTATTDDVAPINTENSAAVDLQNTEVAEVAEAVEVALDDAIIYSSIETYSSAQPNQDAGIYDDDIALLIKSNTDYTTQIISSHQDNYIFSPYQSGYTLAMLAAGAGTGPASEIAISDSGDGQTIDPNTLRALVGSTYGTKDGIEDLHQVINSWDQKLSGVNASLDWQHSRSLWGYKGYNFLTSYLDTMAGYYQAEITGLDLSTVLDENSNVVIQTTDANISRSSITNWLDTNSQGALTQLLALNGNQIDERMRIVTLNNERLNAGWPALFDATQTTDERFELLNGIVKAVPTMHATGTFDTTDTDQYQAFQLPIKNSTLALLVIMPNAGQFETIQSQLSTTPLLEQITAALQPTNTTLHLPHFSITTAEEIKIASANDESYADFSAVNGQGYLHLKQMARIATIDVTEMGLVAQAGGLNILNATSDEPLTVWDPSSSYASAVILTLDTGMMPCYYPALLHPFMFVIRETTTSTILYAGAWTTPYGPEMAPDWSRYPWQSCEDALNPPQK